MRSDQTAQFVATRPYRDGRERNRALYDHSRRVVRVRREDPTGTLAQEPVPTSSGTVIFSGESAECQIGTHRAAVVYAVDSTTHRVETANGEPCGTAWLCVRHWSEYAREEGDDPNLPTVVARFSRALEV